MGDEPKIVVSLQDLYDLKPMVRSIAEDVRVIKLLAEFTRRGLDKPKTAADGIAS